MYDLQITRYEVSEPILQELIHNITSDLFLVVDNKTKNSIKGSKNY